MWLTPSSSARRSTATARSRSLGVPSALLVRRIAPNPIRLTVRSPSVQVPAAAAVTGSGVIAGVFPLVADMPDELGERCGQRRADRRIPDGAVGPGGASRDRHEGAGLPDRNGSDVAQHQGEMLLGAGPPAPGGDVDPGDGLAVDLAAADRPVEKVLQAAGQR